MEMVVSNPVIGDRTVVNGGEPQPGTVRHVSQHGLGERRPRPARHEGSCALSLREPL